MKLWLRQLCLSAVIAVLAFSSVQAKAYTESDKQQAKAWLSSHGYSPTMDGAYAAYNDWLEGKWQDEFGSPDEYFGGEENADIPSVSPEEAAGDPAEFMIEAAEGLLDSLSLFVPAQETAVTGPRWFIRLIAYRTAVLEELRHWKEDFLLTLRYLHTSN